MPTFPSRSLNPPSPIASKIRSRPFIYFGLPFLSIVVISSFALEGFTKTRYDLNDQKVQSVSKEEEMGMRKDRKKIDIREEYYRLSGAPQPSDNILSTSPSSSNSALDTGIPRAPRKSKLSLAPTPQDELENVRVPRPMGIPEWGPPVVSAGDAPKKGYRKEDRWV